MLLELQIQDFALINKLRLSFDRGLNILTGETGAGKSIIIDSVNFVLGERSSKDIIRTGIDKAYVEAVFELVENPEFIEILNEYGIDVSDGIIVFSREINLSGRSLCRINGKTVTTSVLKEIGNYFIDIHGQHEHQSLLNEEYHIKLLDMFGGAPIKDLKSKTSRLYTDVCSIKKQLKDLTGDEGERERRLDLFKFQLNEIDETHLKSGEDEDLSKQRNILSNSEKLFSVLSNSYNALYESSEDTESVFDKLGFILSEMHSIAGLDERLGIMHKSIEDCYYMLEGTIQDIREYRDRIDFNPELIDEIEQRLDTINKLKRKYGSTIEDILKYRDNTETEMKKLENSEEMVKKLKNELEARSKELMETSRQLSDMRKKIAKKLKSSIMDELKYLCMEKSKFEISFENYEEDGQVRCGENGMDVVRFLISTNPGEPLKPLSKIASGGEISRVMLAIKIVLADTDRIPSLIFDEIDTGISGKAAQSVAEKLGQISMCHQVICVTHLPQIASMADTHFYISKTVEHGMTSTNVEKLNAKRRIDEIARMVGGAKLTDLTLKHSEEMINIADGIKKSIRNL